MGKEVEPAQLKPVIIILMGVSGVGKTTIGKLLANDLGWDFYEGDDFHPPENILKMTHGIPLSDEDRIPWLHSLRSLMRSLIHHSRRAIIACSALKQSYREWLIDGKQEVCVVYLRGSYTVIRRRLRSRTEHFMEPDLLPSQFSDLEEPRGVLCVDIDQPPQDIVRRIKGALQISGTA